jgi:beta-lactamase class A
MTFKHSVVRQLSKALAIMTGSLLLLAFPIAMATTAPPSSPGSAMTKTKLSPAQVLERFFKTDKVSADWFTPEFLAAVPIEQVQLIVSQIKQELGVLESVEPESTGFLLKFSQGSVPAQIVLTDEGKVVGLLFSPSRKKIASLEEAIAQFKALPGKVSVLIQEGNTARASLNSTTALGVGSAFKLAILDVLQSQIAAKKFTWQTVVPLQTQFKSLPSGRLHTWPDGSYLTVQSLAAMMISESDNTATDHLIQLVGRENIEAIASNNKPFLMTREFFLLKAKGNKALLASYRSGNLQQKRSILKELAKQPLPDVSEFEGTLPNALDIEWFFTPVQLCQLIDRVSNLPLMGINPGVARTQDWQKIAYKGGSEAGVLNLTTSLQAKDGKRYCFVATWNHDRPLDQAKFMGLYGGMLELLK